jgi:hypothetical protein
MAWRPAANYCRGAPRGRPARLTAPKARLLQIGGSDVRAKRRSREISEEPETQATSSPAHPRIDQGAPHTVTDARRPSPRHRKPVMTAGGSRSAPAAVCGQRICWMRAKHPNGKSRGRRKKRRTQPPSDPERE